MKDIDFAKLAEPFPAGDVEWRVSRSWRNDEKIYCTVLCYITARAIANRLDQVCGPENWMNTQQQIKELRPGTFSVQVGISIKVGDDWVTKYDVAEPTGIEAAKGGFSGAMKRAGAQWGIGRYLYLLDEEFAEVNLKPDKAWNRARLKKEEGGTVFYWKPPRLPSWALPPVADPAAAPEAKVTEQMVIRLKHEWMQKFAPTERNRSTLAEGFQTFVTKVVGEIKADHHECWTMGMLAEVRNRINATRDARGPSSDIPFGG